MSTTTIALIVHLIIYLRQFLQTNIPCPPCQIRKNTLESNSGWYRNRGADHSFFTASRFDHSGRISTCGGGLLFLLSLMDYSVPYLFGKNVYTLEVFADFTAHNQPGRSLLIASPLVGMALLIILISFAGARSLVVPSQGKDRLWRTGMSLPKWFHFLGFSSIIFLVTAALAPLILLWLLVGSLPELTSSLVNGTPETLFTLTTSLLTGMICLPFALAASRVLTIPNRRSLALGRSGISHTGAFDRTGIIC